MANHNGAAFIADAIRSVLQQELKDLELIVADDASSDESVSIVDAAARSDSRVVLLTGSANVGPAGARNRALACARGRWIAVMDSDDLMHPERLSRLVRVGEAHGAEIVADDCLEFDHDGRFPPASLLGAYGGRARWLDLPEFVRRNLIFGSGPALGYLKPIIRRDMIERLALRYDERLRVAEDYDFIARMMHAGARFYLDSSLGYFYRKHSQSISHRLKSERLAEILEADDRFRRLGSVSPELQAALNLRRQSLRRAQAFTELVDALKEGRLGQALAVGLRHPASLPLLRYPISAKMRRSLAGLVPHGRQAGETVARKRAYVISRQRVVGNTNGSSTYLISLSGALRDQGFEVHYIAPSPAVFGRWPVLRFAPEMDVFASIRIRGAWRLGRFAVAQDPRIGLRGGLTVLERALNRAGIRTGQWVNPAPYAIALPWSREDELFVAGATRAPAQLLLADYAFLTHGFPFCLQPSARTAVVMHDLFSNRASQFQRLGAADSVSSLQLSTEMDMLGKAQAVLAIQPHEAQVVRTHLPDRKVILTPMAVEPVPAAQPGTGRSVLFVGSNTAPNVLGLRWFVTDVWPMVRKSDPNAILQVAGGVCDSLREPFEGVRLLGFVSDLDSTYRDAAVVISPLQVGSGLKIKLIEALGRGKAIVATPTTIEGVEREVEGAIFVSDQPEPFAESIVRLLEDDELRLRYAEAALAVANRNFTAAQCYRDFIRFVEGSPAGSAEASVRLPLAERESVLEPSAGME
jgi:succinoglycan biosynthesis protein ExoO